MIGKDKGYSLTTKMQYIKDILKQKNATYVMLNQQMEIEKVIENVWNTIIYPNV